MGEDDVTGDPGPQPHDYPEFDNVVPLPGAKPADVSEDAIALAFTRQYGDTMRFDHDVGRWYQWQGSRWAPLTVPVAFHYAREIGRTLSAAQKAICKASVAAGAEKFARADPIHAVDQSIWDSDPLLLGTPVGTLNLATGRMHAPRKSDSITKQTACAPENKPATRWLQFLDEATNHDVGMQIYLQRIAGYCLTGLTNEHALFFVYGPGGNGKSVFLNLLVHILGDYALSAPMDTFTASKFNSHPTDLAMLKGARLVTASETEEGRAWAEARIKQLTGGDPITARFMRQDFFTYQPQFKLLFAGNHQPTLNSVDPAMQRRFNMMPFLHKPATPDHMLEVTLKAEAPRILAWALQGCLDWQKRGLARPAAVAAATNDYFSQQDLIGQWIEDCCELGENQWDTPTTLFRSWHNYARAAEEPSGTGKSFGSALEKRGFRRAKSGSIRMHKGIAVKRQGTDFDE